MQLGSLHHLLCHCCPLIYKFMPNHVDYLCFYLSVFTMDPFQRVPFEVMAMIIRYLDPTTTTAIMLMTVSRLWQQQMPHWTLRSQRIIHLSGNQLVHAIPLVYTGPLLLDIVINPPEHPLASLEIEQVLISLLQLNLPLILSLSKFLYIPCYISYTHSPCSTRCTQNKR